MIRPNFNRTKIVATIGPSCSEKRTLEKMFAKGVDVCRLNFSHGDHKTHLKVLETIRQINKENNLHVCILGDLQGPKLRVGKMQNDGVELKEETHLVITTQECEGTAERVYINYPEFPYDVVVGDRVLLDDGKIELEVTDSNKNDEVTTKIIYGGILQSNKGVNLPNTNISLPSMTEKDYRDLQFVLDHDFEWVGLSFVRSPDDLVKLKEIIENRGKFTKVVAKIEKPSAIEMIDDILKVTDGVMIARGDLGVETPMEELPLVQKNIVRKCLKLSKPVIIATQMMESMIENPRPTRAEANDVANAVLDGADAVMLSAETSVGKYPVEVIEHMERIIHHVEKEESIFTVQKNVDKKSITFFADAICQNAVFVAREVGAKGIIGMTKSGYTGFQLSSHRPRAFIFVFSNNRMLLNTLNLVWGVRGFYYDKFVSTDQTFEDVINILRNKSFVHQGDVVINTASMPIHEKARTNMIKISRVK